MPALVKCFFEVCFNDKIAKSSETQFYENFTKNK